MKTFFPIVLIILDICAGLTYGYFGDYKHLVYWLAAATLTICVTI